MFGVGQKVTMIAPWDAFVNPYPDVVFTEFGKIYTVREILVVGSQWDAIRVQEILNQPHLYARRGLIEQPFPAGNFRPIVERKTSIEIFKRMLRPQEVDA